MSQVLSPLSFFASRRLARRRCVAAISLPAHAHHAFAAEFDADKTIDLRGVVTKIKWVNPSQLAVLRCERHGRHGDQLGRGVRRAESAVEDRHHEGRCSPGHAGTYQRISRQERRPLRLFGDVTLPDGRVFQTGGAQDAPARHRRSAETNAQTISHPCRRLRSFLPIASARRPIAYLACERQARLFRDLAATLRPNAFASRTRRVRMHRPRRAIVEGNVIPYLPAALERKKRISSDAAADPRLKCWTLGTPRGIYYPEPFQIFQRDRDLTIVSQFGHSVRTIHHERHAASEVARQRVPARAVRWRRAPLTKLTKRSSSIAGTYSVRSAPCRARGTFNWARIAFYSAPITRRRWRIPAMSAPLESLRAPASPSREELPADLNTTATRATSTSTTRCPGRTNEPWNSSRRS